MTHGLDVGAPFHLEATVRLLQRRPRNPVDKWEDGTHLRALDLGGLVLVATRNEGTLDAPRVTVRVLAGEVARIDWKRLLARVSGLLGAGVDPAAIERVADVIPGVEPLVHALRGMRPPAYGDLFEAISSVIPFQQVSLDSGIAIQARMVHRLGRAIEWEGRTFRAALRADDVADARVSLLRGTGLSEAKAKALVHAAREIADGRLGLDELRAMPTSEAALRLRELPGLGPWSANLVLLRGLGRLDAFPPGDVGVARGLSKLSGATLTPADCVRLGERLEGAGGWLYFLSLGAQLVEKGLVRAAPDPEER